MPRKWLGFVAVLLAAAVMWNEYRLWSHRELGAALQVVRSAHDDAVLAAAPSPVDGEEESEATVIDLSWLQRQTIEPPVADTQEPATLPVVPEPPHQFIPMPKACPSVAQFEPHSADGPDGDMKTKATAVWKTFTGWFWSTAAESGAEESELHNPIIEQLFVFPRPVAAPQRCPETSVCPYLNGTAGQHYRR